MLETSTLSAREIALRVLRQLEAGQATCDRLLQDLLSRLSLPAVERGLAVELIYGVERWRGKIDWILAQVSRYPLVDLTPWIRNILRLGAYQLLFLERVPASAAVNEAVKLAHRHGHPGTAKLVNGVLREVERRRENWKVLEPGGDPAHTLAVTHSHPEWLVRRWIRRWGLEKAAEICATNNRIPPTTVRINTLRVDRDEVEKLLSREKVEFFRCSLFHEALHLNLHGAVTALTAFQKGLFTVQDEGAILVAPLLDPAPGDRILEICAAPGGKTTHLGERMENQGEILAVDRSRRRLSLLEDNCRRLGLTLVRPLASDILSRALSEGLWEKVLVDVPCSNLGMLRRNPDARWLHREEDLERLPVTQLQILRSAGDYVAPRGVLVYATCSNEKEENEGVVSQFLQENPGFHVESVMPFLPAEAAGAVGRSGYLEVVPGCGEAGGIFAARLRRS